MLHEGLGPYDLSTHLVFGLISAGLSVLAYAPYFYDTWQGRTSPHRACWFIWSTLATISFFSLRHEGAGLALWFAGAQSSCTLMIFLLSLIRGHGAWLTKTDGLVLGVAAVGLTLWAVTDRAHYALGLSIAISLLAGSLTIRKAYTNPNSETPATWTLSWLASCAALAAVSGDGLLGLAYPMYLFALTGAILAALLLGQRRPVQIPVCGAPDPRWPRAPQLPSKGLMPQNPRPFPPHRNTHRPRRRAI